MAAWWAYKRRLVQLSDLRAWFACCELVAQRRASDAELKFRPGPQHLARLTGSTETAARAAIRRLMAADVLTDTGDGFAIPDQFVAHWLAGDAQLQHVYGQFRLHARRVPFTRRMLRVLARSSRPVFIATVEAWTPGATPVSLASR